MQSKLDGFLLSATVVCLPFSTYIAIHAPVIAHAIHLWSILLLAALPMIYMSVTPHTLWWLPGPPLLVKGLSRLIGLVATGLLVAGLQGRVVFHAFAPYIPFSAPWNVVVVNVALAGMVLLVMAHVSGALGTMDTPVAAACLLLVTASGALVAGIPLWVLPAPLAAAAGLALYYDTGDSWGDAEWVCVR
jgi:hypothetical protein